MAGTGKVRFVLVSAGALCNRISKTTVMDTKSQAEHLEDTAQNTLENFHETSEEIQNRLGEFWETSKERAASCARATDQAIRENPWQAVGIALGVGLLFGLLLSSRSGRNTDED